jgi:hypothetical protein
MTIFSLSRVSLVSAVFISGLLLGCGGGGGGGDPEPTPKPEADTSAKATQCKDFETAESGSYRVENNVWNKGAISNFRQCVGIAASKTGGATAVWEWDWPVSSDNAVRSYPEIIFGQKPWNTNTAPGQLPRVIDQIKTVRVQTTFTSKHTGAGALAFDMWLTSSNVPVGNQLPIKHELMIWLEAYGMQPAGQRVETTTIAGVTWDLYTTIATRAGPSFQYLAYVPRQPVASPASIDVRLFLDHLKKRGSISGQEWLASIELGNEVMNGKGRTELQDFKVTVD